MKLESELRIRLQLRQLESAWRDHAPTTQCPPAHSTWVKLIQPLSFVDSDEALLLCPCSDHQWLAWIPDHGEVVLDITEFCPLPHPECF